MSQFVPVKTLVDPNENEEVDALTRFAFQLEKKPFIKLEAKFAMPEKFKITVKPIAKIKIGVKMSWTFRAWAIALLPRLFSYKSLGFENSFH